MNLWGPVLDFVDLEKLCNSHEIPHIDTVCYIKQENNLLSKEQSNADASISYVGVYCYVMNLKKSR